MRFWRVGMADTLQLSARAAIAAVVVTFIADADVGGRKWFEN